MAQQVSNVYDWMCLNVDKVVEAVRADGGHMSGPTCGALLDEAFKVASPGRSRERARELLRIKLEGAGFHGLL